MGSVDLKDAYYSVPVHPSEKYLRFVFGILLYQYICLPNGLASAFCVFTKLLKQIFSYLSAKGYISLYYLDDTLLIGHDIPSFKSNIEVTSDTLEKLVLSLI